MRVCADLNVWIAAQLARRDRHEGTTSQRIEQWLTDGDGVLGPVQLVVSWPMLDQLAQVLTHGFGVSAQDAREYVDALAQVAQAGSMGFAPADTLGDPGVIDVRDPVEPLALQTAFAGQADVLITANFAAITDPSFTVLVPDSSGALVRDGHRLRVVHPRRMGQLMRDEEQALAVAG
jgi:predicted nucleic acid-binding protein